MDRLTVNDGRISPWRWLVLTLLVGWLAAGCALGQDMSEPSSGSGEPAPAAAAPVATPVASAPDASATQPALEVEPTAEMEQAAVSQATPLAPNLTPRPTNAAQGSSIQGRLIYTRKGNIHQWSGASSQQLTSTGDLSMARWSPDGERIAAIRVGDSFSDVTLLDRLGQNPTRLTQHQSQLTPGSKEYVSASIWALNPAWSPDGADILYSADVEDTNLSLWVVQSAGGDPRPLLVTSGFGANIEEATFAPTGDRIAFTASNDTPTQLWVADLATGVRAELTDGQHTTHDPTWSPDSSVLAAVIIQDGTSSIWLISPDGQERGQIVSQPAARAPVWSPDGSRLAFIGEENGRLNVYVVDISRNAAGGYVTSPPRRLTNDGDIDATSGLSWAA